jgi:hypothetical protein
MQEMQETAKMPAMKQTQMQVARHSHNIRRLLYRFGAVGALVAAPRSVMGWTLSCSGRIKTVTTLFPEATSLKDGHHQSIAPLHLGVPLQKISSGIGI